MFYHWRSDIFYFDKLLLKAFSKKKLQMVIKEKIGNINTIQIDNLAIDYLQIHWHESNKRILHKKTNAGIDIVMKFLNENQQLTTGDVLYKDAETIIIIDVIDCEAIVIQPKTMYEMASICYEIGNKHLPLFFDKDELLIPFEQPIFKLLTAQGYDVTIEKRKLLTPLKTTVAAHGNSSGTLFSKIMKMTSPNE
jgi:urease accessory protein